MLRNCWYIMTSRLLVSLRRKRDSLSQVAGSLVVGLIDDVFTMTPLLLCQFVYVALALLYVTCAEYY